MRQRCSLDATSSRMAPTSASSATRRSAWALSIASSLPVIATTCRRSLPAATSFACPRRWKACPSSSSRRWPRASRWWRPRWAENPMTYDWRGEIPFAPGSPEYLAEVERRFLAEAWFAQPAGSPPFSGLIPFAELEGRDVLEIGCGTGVHAKLLAAAGARVTAVDLTPTAIELTRRRLDLA